MRRVRKPVAVFCGDQTNRIFAARNWRVGKRVGERGGIVRIIGPQDDVTRAACLAVAKHLSRCPGCDDCSVVQARSEER